ncbi:MAG: hypothetical protein K6G83_06755 [Lachnospiraceae bacterium]|nr:hypothetical protein [Lachnospiraceae bacterium]
MRKTKIQIIRVYEGTRTAKEVLVDAIAYKVRKKLDSDMELIRGKEYNQDSTQGLPISLSGLCG